MPSQSTSCANHLLMQTATSLSPISFCTIHWKCYIRVLCSRVWTQLRWSTKKNWHRHSHSLCQRFFINVCQIFLNYQHREKSLTEVFWLWRDVKAVKTIPNRSSWQTESDSFNSFSPIQKHQAPNSEQLIDNMLLSFPQSWKDQTPDTTSWKQNFLCICILRTSKVGCSVQRKLREAIL